MEIVLEIMNNYFLSHVLILSLKTYTQYLIQVLQDTIGTSQICWGYRTSKGENSNPKKRDEIFLGVSNVTSWLSTPWWLTHYNTSYFDTSHLESMTIETFWRVLFSLTHFSKNLIRSTMLTVCDSLKLRLIKS